ncbi:hypothetical protein, partial [Mesorhizobium sp.]|uniref:hypothetical protein n=1 Tax=Mesorhizobium sp. TaxID=1871066 RepID=UPI002580718A
SRTVACLRVLAFGCGRAGRRQGRGRIRHPDNELAGRFRARSKIDRKGLASDRAFLLTGRGPHLRER